MEQGYFESEGLRLYYQIEGTGQPMILLSGGPGFPHDYLEALRPLADTAQLIFYDQRGTGKSDKAPGAYTIPASVADLEALREHLGLEQFTLFGHSWGGMLAQAYAAAYPERLRRLIVADSFSSIPELNAALARMRAAVPPEVEAVYQKHEAAGIYASGDRYAEEYQSALDIAYEPVSIGVAPPPELEHIFADVAYDVYRAMWGEESEFRVTGTLAEFDVEAALARVTAPTLVLAGASDMASVAMVERTASLFPRARLEIFDHSRHYPFLEEPAKFFGLLHEFLADN